MMAFRSWIVPRMLDAWVQVTRRVRGVSRGVRSEARSLGSCREDGSHHLMTSCWRSARSTHGAMLASWSMPERTSSSPGWKARVAETLRKSCVVDAPRTVWGKEDEDFDSLEVSLGSLFSSSFFPGVLIHLRVSTHRHVLPPPPRERSLKLASYVPISSRDALIYLAAAWYASSYRYSTGFVC